MPDYSSGKKYYFLALGDSYTIGESIPALENFPNQTVSLVQKKYPGIQAARVIARTGWTTDELEAGIAAANAAEPLHSSYDFVTLLIGVNNQYRGRPVENYKIEFEGLIKKAIAFAGGNANRVIVISIPDWGVTPFANGQDRNRIAEEIDVYNASNKQIALQYHTYYLDITPWTREAATDNSLLAEDGVHPSGKEYARWAIPLSNFFIQLFNKE